MKPLQDALSAIVAELEGTSVGDASTIFKAHALLGQVDLRRRQSEAPQRSARGWLDHATWAVTDGRLQRHAKQHPGPQSREIGECRVICRCAGSKAILMKRAPGADFFVTPVLAVTANFGADIDWRKEWRTASTAS